MLMLGPIQSSPLDHNLSAMQEHVSGGFQKQQNVLREKDSDNEPAEKNLYTEVETPQCFSPEGPQLHCPAENASLSSYNIAHRYPMRIPGRVAFMQLCWQHFVSYLLPQEALLRRQRQWKGQWEALINLQWLSLYIIRISYMHKKL